jgi:hypothetical protein
MVGQNESYAIDSHRSLFYVLFVIFETLLFAGVVGLWSVDPRRMSGLDDVAGITLLFSMVGISIVYRLLRRLAPRLARLGWISVPAGFVACALVPAVP